eukprot:scaffold9727_cov61-Attheya_sp.AAC.1
MGQKNKCSGSSDGSHEVDWKTKQIEPYSPWPNAAGEGLIRELKQGSGGRKMVVLTKSPKVLLDDCLEEVEAYIRSHTALYLYCLKGKVPEMIISSQMPDI